CPPHGAKAICGRRPRMEDAYTAIPFLMEASNFVETLHFFGVFDGHGGAEGALHCAQTLHQRFAAAEAAACGVARGNNAAAAAEGAESQNENTIACSAQHFETALTDAFNRTDEEFGKADNAALVGTTAVVALVGSRQLYVANCGDSRAVLCRGGAAIALTDDHKAAREDETARVEAAGGQILFWNGVRVMGVLAVSRAIGDHCLRPFVIAQPEVTILGRRPDDEILLLASDGLWDVLSNQEACTLAKRCLRRARQRGASRQSAARIAATVLTRAAVDRGSRDNVTVVVVDL
ncbi:protein phosphatase 2C catalytic subunit, partial [Coccomyxa subellipsoidea C-169]